MLTTCEAFNSEMKIVEKKILENFKQLANVV